MKKFFFWGGTNRKVPKACLLVFITVKITIFKKDPKISYYAIITLVPKVPLDLNRHSNSFYTLKDMLRNIYYCPRTHRSRDRCGGGISLMPPRETGHKNLRIFSFRCDQRMIDSSDCSQKALFTLSQNINRIPTVMHMEYK